MKTTVTRSSVILGIVLAFGLVSSVRGGPIPPGPTGNFINNSAAPQTGAQFNVSSATVRGKLTVGELQMSSVTAGQVTATGAFNGPATGLTGVPLTSLTPGALPTNVVASSVANSGVVPGIYGGPDNYTQIRVTPDGRIISAVQGNISTGYVRLNSTQTLTGTNTFTKAIVGDITGRAAGTEALIGPTTAQLRTDLGLETAARVLGDYNLGVDTTTLYNTKVAKAGDTMTGDLNLSASSVAFSGGSLLDPDVIRLNTSFVKTACTAGEIWWNLDDETANLCIYGGLVTLQIGQEMLFKAKMIGTAGLNGQVVAITGASGNRPEIELADADDPRLNKCIVGVLTEGSGENQPAIFTAFGNVRDTNTDHLVEGAKFYVSTTPGQTTATVPPFPARVIQLGIVIRKSPTVGTLFVNVLDTPDDIRVSSMTATEIYGSSMTLTGAASAASLATSGQIITGGTMTVQGTDFSVGEDKLHFSDGKLGIGTESPIAAVHVSSNNTTYTGFMVDVYGAGANPSFLGRRAAGSKEFPTAVVNNANLMSFGGFGYGATGFPPFARAIVELQAAENWTDTSQGTQINFRTTPRGTTAIGTIMKIDGTGKLKIGVGAGSGDATQTLSVLGNADFSGVLIASGTSMPNYLAGDLLFGSGGTDIFNNTSDGADNSYFLMNGGGANAIARGAMFQLSGNEQASTAGDFIMWAGNVATGDIEMRTGSGTTKLIVKNSGDVGIGTSTPAANAEIVGANEPINGGYTYEGNLFIRSNNAQGANIGGSIGLGGVYQGTGVAVSFAKIHGKKETGTSGALDGYLAFETANNTDAPYSAERMRISSTGNVGINTSTPTAKLHLSSGTFLADGLAAMVQITKGAGSAVNGYAIRVSSSTNEHIFGVHNDGHISIGGYAATLGTCTNGALAANSHDVAGAIEFSGANTSCAVVFGNARDAEPFCVVSLRTAAPGPLPVLTAETTAGFTIAPNTGGFAAGDRINWWCPEAHE